MTWKYQGLDFTDPGTNFGFVYRITHLPTNKQYLGRKYFTLSATRQVKGKKKRYRKDSGWQDYWGSSKELQADVDLHGQEQFSREILRLCKSKSECSYFESKYILEEDALLKESYYNAWLSVRVVGANVK